MSALDALVFTIICLFVLRGLWVGFIRQMASMLALVLGFVVAGQYYGRSASLVTPFVSNHQLGFLVAYGLLFAIVFLGTIFIGLGFRKVVQVTMLGWFDRVMGGIMGAFKGLFLACIVFMSLAIFINGDNPLFTKSRLYPLLERSTMILLMTVRDHKLRGHLLPRKPAISKMLDSTVKFGKEISRQAKEKTDNY